MSERALTLSQAADRLGWSRRTLTRKLVEHQISTFGSGRLERIEPAALEMLKAKERKCRTNSFHPENGGPVGTFAARMRPGLSNSQRAKKIGAMLRGGSKRYSSPIGRVVAFPAEEQK